MENLKKCSNCSRAPQPIEEFKGRHGKECNTCMKCREKGKKSDLTSARLEKHKQLQKQKGNEYSQASRARRLEADPEAYRTHNNEIRRDWYSKNKNRMHEWQKKNINAKLSASKDQAHKRCLIWDLTDDQAKDMMTSECTYCGFLNLDLITNGIDRLDSSKGYTPENCVPCCKDCNYLKGTYDPVSFLNKCKQIVSHFNPEHFVHVPICLEHKYRRAALFGTE
jgi:hypothetical protein